MEHRESLGYHTLHDTIMMDVLMHFSKPIECTTSRVKFNVNYRLWVLMMCQCVIIIVTIVMHHSGGQC